MVGTIRLEHEATAEGGGGAIELDGVGKLTAPALIAAFEGWNDAGEAASGVINHLAHRLGHHSQSARSTPRTSTTSR